MVRNWKSVSVGTSLALAAVALGLYAHQRAHAVPTYHLAGGIDVTPVEVQADDTAQVLSVKVWKFDVVVPDPERGYIFPVSLYRNGKRVQSLGGIGSSSTSGHWSSKHRTLFIGMVPVDGDFWQAHQIRAKYMIEGQNSSSNTFINPFSLGMGLADRSQSFDGGKSICLMYGSRGYDDHGKPLDDTALVLTAEALPNSQ